MLMLCVTTPEDRITARAKMDFMEMEKLAEVTIAVYYILSYHSEELQCNAMEYKGKRWLLSQNALRNLTEPITHVKSHIFA